MGHLAVRLPIGCKPVDTRGNSKRFAEKLLGSEGRLVAGVGFEPTTFRLRNIGSREWSSAALHPPNAGELPQLLREPKSEQNRNICVVRIDIVEVMYVRQAIFRKSKIIGRTEARRSEFGPKGGAS